MAASSTSIRSCPRSAARSTKRRICSTATREAEFWPKTEEYKNRWNIPAFPAASKWLIRADSARPETVSYMKRHGFKITEAIKGPGSIEDGIEFLRSFDIIVHPRAKHVSDELTLYSYKTDPQTNEILPMLEDKDNHTIDALRYALEELRRTGWKPKPEVRNAKPGDRWSRAMNREGEGASWKTA
jgi:hypothetical protein